MLTIKTVNKLLRFNLRNYKVEQTFKEILINEAIDQSGKKVRIRFNHANYDRKVGKQIIDTKEVLRITFEEKKFYENNMYYSVTNFNTKEEKVCEC